MTTQTSRTEARPPASSAATRRRMENQTRRDTTPEIRLRRALHKRGLRYRLQVSPIPGLRRKVDLVFPASRVAVDVRGCFWHACPEHATAPKSNRAWWAEKLEANRRRDQNTESRLVEAGWRVVVVWEHDDVEVAAATIECVIRGRS